VVLPYNAPDRILRAHADELAGVIVEPVIGRPVSPPTASSWSVCAG